MTEKEEILRNLNEKSWRYLILWAMGKRSCGALEVSEVLELPGILDGAVKVQKILEAMEKDGEVYEAQPKSYKRLTAWRDPGARSYLKAMGKFSSKLEETRSE